MDKLLIKEICFMYYSSSLLIPQELMMLLFWDFGVKTSGELSFEDLRRCLYKKKIVCNFTVRDNSEIIGINCDGIFHLSNKNIYFLKTIAKYVNEGGHMTFYAYDDAGKHSFFRFVFCDKSFILLKSKELSGHIWEGIDISELFSDLENK